MDYRGEMEAHVTVRLSDAGDAARLQAWSAARGLRCVHIVLACGAAPSQPMLTFRAVGTASAQRLRAERLAAELAADGFPPTRIKIEAAPWCAGVPQTDEEALGRPPEACFEHHLKLLLEPQPELHALAERARRRGARLSLNAFKARSDGRTERFVTQRCYHVGRPAAAGRLAALRSDLEAYCEERPERGRRILDVEEEYVVYDSRLDLDAGWLEPLQETCERRSRKEGEE